MLVFGFFSWLAIPSTNASSAASERSPAADPPHQSTGFTDIVQWDNYTLFLRDQRLFLQWVLCCFVSDAPAYLHVSQCRGVPYIQIAGPRALARYLPEHGCRGSEWGQVRERTPVQNT